MIMDRPTGVFINYLTVCCQSLSIKKMIELTQEELKQYFSEPIFGHIAETAAVSDKTVDEILSLTNAAANEKNTEKKAPKFGHLKFGDNYDVSAE